MKFKFDISYYRSGLWQRVGGCFRELSLALFGAIVASKGDKTILYQHIWHTTWARVFAEIQERKGTEGVGNE